MAKTTFIIMKEITSVTGDKVNFKCTVGEIKDN